MLLPFTPADAGPVMRDHLADKREIREIAMAQARLNDGQTLYGVDGSLHRTAQPCLCPLSAGVGRPASGGSPSGIIVSTGLGSTGWLRSLYAGWAGMTAALTGGVRPADVEEQGRFAWDVNAVLRCASPSPAAARRPSWCSEITAAATLQVTSLMPENGTIFSDGIRGGLPRLQQWRHRHHRRRRAARPAGCLTWVRL